MRIIKDLIKLLFTIITIYIVQKYVKNKELYLFINSILIFFLANIIRNFFLWEYLGFKNYKLNEILENNKYLIQTIIKKSSWFYIPFIYFYILCDLSLNEIGLGFKFYTIGNLISLTILLFIIRLFLNSYLNEIKLILKGFIKAFFVAGFFEDFLIIGIIGNRFFYLLNIYLNAYVSMILAFLIINLSFALSHIPAVKKSKEDYSKNMGIKKFSYKRQVIQMFVFGIPSWLLFFLSGHLIYSFLYHSLVDTMPFSGVNNS